MGITEKIGTNNWLLTFNFCMFFSTGANFLSFLDLKAGTFLEQKRLKSLYFNALRVDRQASGIRTIS